MAIVPSLSPPSAARPSSLDDVLAAELARLRALDRERFLRPVRARRGSVVQTSLGPAIDFSSNDYLGLASDPRLGAAAARVLDSQGTGAAAARLISGDHPEHHALETDLARWFGADAALSFSSGYAANTGILPALVGRGDVVFSDALNHASLIDGCRLSRADVHVYPHADAGALHRLLERHRGGARCAIIVTDGLFSMDGDVAPLADLVDLARRFNAWTYVDDAHAMGVSGARGRGSIEQAGLEGAIDIMVGTLGKAFGVAGAFVLGSNTLIQYLMNRARSFVFSTGVPPALAAAAREALRIAAAEPERRERVRANAGLLRRHLTGMGIPVLSSGEATQIVPVPIGGDARTARVGRALAARGFLVGAIRPPTVPDGSARLRITVGAAHSAEQITALGAALAGVLRESDTDDPNAAVSPWQFAGTATDLDAPVPPASVE